VASKLSLFLAEFRRRKVGRVAVVYVLVGLGAIEAVDIIGSRLLFPEWSIQFVIVLVLIGFPIALVLAWALEVTPEGIQRTPDLSPEQLAAQTPVRWSRSSWVLSGVGFVVVLAAGYFGFFRGGDGVVEDVREHRLAVLPPENQTGDPSLDVLANAAASWITDGLARADLALVVPSTDVLAASRAVASEGGGPSAILSSWPQETGATIAIRGSFFTSGDSIQFRQRIVDRSGTVLATVDPVSVPGDGPASGLNALQLKVVGAVADILAPGSEISVSLGGRSPPDLEAHQAFLEAVVVFNNQGSARSIPYLLRALELDPDYEAPYMYLGWAYSNTGRYALADSVCQVLESRDFELVEWQRLVAQMNCQGTHGELPARLQTARRLVEHGGNWNYLLGLAAMDLNRPQEAVEAFARYDPHLSRAARDWADRNFNQWARAYHMLGDYEGELDVVREGRELFPGGLTTREMEGLIGLGRFEGAEELVDSLLSELSPGQRPTTILNSAALEFDAHGNPEGAKARWEQALDWIRSRSPEERSSFASRRGQAIYLLYLGRDTEAQPYLEAMAEENPNDMVVVALLGTLAARQGRADEAESISEALRVWDEGYLLGTNTLYRAGIAAALGDVEGAVALLGQAMEEGWRFGTGGAPTHADPFFKPLRGHAAFEDFMRPKG
jgi:tetratricopeptide (TPR) repeat protein